MPVDPLDPILIGVVTFVASLVGAYFGGYLKERGKTLATSVDIDRISRQLEITTKATESARADIQNSLWWSQESWKRKYDIYHSLFVSFEAIGELIASVMERLNGALPGEAINILHFGPSNEGDAVSALPELGAPLKELEEAYGKLLEFYIGATLLLNSAANEALAELQKANSRASIVVNFTFYQRLQIRLDALYKCRLALMDASKPDLLFNRVSM